MTTTTTATTKQPWSLNEHCAACHVRLRPFQWIGNGCPAFCSEHRAEASLIGSTRMNEKYGRDFWNGRAGRSEEEQSNFLFGLNPYTGEDDKPF